jgi:hypothetical protein
MRADTQGLPGHLLKPLTLRKATSTADEFGALTKTFTDVAITGRITRNRGRESTGEGMMREGDLAEGKLLTNSGQVGTADQVIDPTEPGVWEVAGPPYPVQGHVGTHHYEVWLKRMEG